MPGLMQGKRGLVMGVANDHSIAWGIAKMLHEHGAEMAFTYQGSGGGAAEPVGGAGDEDTGHGIILPLSVLPCGARA